MKHLKFLFLGLGCMTVLSLNSCMKTEESDNGLTNSEISQCLTAVRGNYTGHLLYSAYNAQKPSDDTDTLEIDWTITADTTLIVRQFPLAPITEKIVDLNLKQALKEQSPFGELKCNMLFTMIDPYVEFLLAPQKLDVPVFYNEQTHTLSVYFWFDSHSFGAKNLVTQDMNVYLVAAAAYLDDNTSNNLLNRDFSQTSQIAILLTTMDLEENE